MDIETQGLGAGSYPEPEELKYKEVNVKVRLTFNLHFEVPKTWSEEQIIEDVKENLNEYRQYDEDIEEIEIN